MVGPGNTPEEHAVVLGAGTRLGKYEVLRLLGTGGMGAVYEGFHTEMGKRVAIKILSPAIAAVPGARARFLREAQLTSRVRHPNIVDVTDMGSEAGQTYLVMELLRGEDMSQRLARTGPLPTQELVDIMLPVCSAVVAAHQVGVTHRDLKPQNIFLADGPHTIQPKVLDFGISKGNDAVTAGSLTGTGAMVGTPFYLSPEQVMDSRTAGPQSDQYALGVILYECLTGRRPFDSESLFVVLQAIVAGSPPRPRQIIPELSPVLEEIVLQAMRLDPQARFASTRELGRALLPFGSVRSRSIWDEAFRGAGSGVPAPAREPVSGVEVSDGGGRKAARFATPPEAVANKAATPSTLRHWPSSSPVGTPPGPAPGPGAPGSPIRSTPDQDGVPTEPHPRMADTRSLDNVPFSSVAGDVRRSETLDGDAGDDGAIDEAVRAQRWLRIARATTIGGLVLAGMILAVVALRKPAAPRVKAALGSPALAETEPPAPRAELQALKPTGATGESSRKSVIPPPSDPSPASAPVPAARAPESPAGLPVEPARPPGTSSGAASTAGAGAPAPAPAAEPKTQASRRPAAAEPAVTAETFTIDVTVDPETASIILDGVPVGVGHLARTLPIDHERHILRFMNEGYVSRRLAFTDASPPEQVTLVPRPAPPAEPEPESLPRPGRRPDSRTTVPRSLNPNGAPVID